MAQNGTAVQQSRSRSGLLVAKEMLDDKLSDDGKAIMSEFERLRRMPLTGSMSDARSGGNARLNRYFNVLPFDANRVRLENGTSDYINASLLTSPPEEQPSWEYIATQGPKDSTMEDFWQMVYKQRCAVIIMLTRATESGSVKKCAQYFPEELSQRGAYGGWRVECTSLQEVDSDVSRRDLVVTPPKGSGQPCQVVHFHYHAWPDHGVPSTTQPLRDLVSAVKQLEVQEAGPAVVHCSAGIGRTGTFCAVDIALQRLRSPDYSAAVSAAELKPVVAELRRQRCGMVQTPEQYHFCYQAIKDEVDLELLGQ
ncbi:g11230 [Coccomyxa viridis]|uniref:G11230 protein n=1 Tax=Coccomyxa viridis TaxID=1274662 RepID=A0ABP1GA48_9CHLO